MMTARRILFASLTTLAACASLPGVHGLTASTSGVTSPTGASAPAPAAADGGSGDRGDSGSFAGAWAPSAAPDPATSWQNKPETDARRDENGAVVYPGPTTNSYSGAVDCSAAHNHCLHSNTWFVSDLAEPEAMPKLAFRFEDQFYTWRNAEKLTDYAGYTAYKTAPATPDNTKPGSIVVFYLAESADEAIPTAGKARTDSLWRMGTVKSVDAAAGNFRIARGPRHGFSRARVVVASEPMR